MAKTNMKASLALVLIVSISCYNRDNSPCATSRYAGDDAELIRQLPWLNNIINGKTNCTILTMASVTEYTYNNAQVFYLENPANAVYMCTQTVYDCQGNILITAANGKELDTFLQNATNKKVIWQKLP